MTVTAEPNVFVTAYGTTVKVDRTGYPVLTSAGPRCGACRGRHGNVAAIKLCHDIATEQAAEVEASHRAEQRAERYLEDRGYEAARAQDDYEARSGVVGFIEAWHLASPETCPCGAH